MTPVLGTLKKGLVFVVSAPAGTGKTTLVKRLMAEFPEVVLNISFTTRAPREGEVEGQDYHFVSEAKFAEKILASEFLEYVKLYDTYYGSSLNWIAEQRQLGRHVFLVIDTQGAMQIKEHLDAVFIFIRPPSLEILRERLVGRKTESETMVQKRIEWAEQELRVADQYDYQILNEDLETAYQVLRSILIAACHRTAATSW